jgi:hypothetical protein
MFSLRDLTGFLSVAGMLTAPCLATASLVSLAPWVGVADDPLGDLPDMPGLWVWCAVLVVLVCLTIIAVSSLLFWLDEHLVGIPLAGDYLLVLWVGLSCITVGLLVLGTVIPGLPASPLNPLWHVGLLGYGVLILQIGQDRRKDAQRQGVHR